MNRQRLLLLALLCAALAGSLPLGVDRWQFRAQWRAADARAREDILFGPYAPAIAKVRRMVPEDGTILLFSGVDPALFPYAVHPRRIWQVLTEPETDAIYMQLPPSPFLPARSPESFQVGWHLLVTPENLGAGGELRRVADDTGRRVRR